VSCEEIKKEGRKEKMREHHKKETSYLYNAVWNRTETQN
jgi:hypothetical protein